MTKNQNRFAGALKDAMLGVVSDWTLSERADYFYDLHDWAFIQHMACVAERAGKESIDIKTILNKNNNGKQSDGRHDDGR